MGIIKKTKSIKLQNPLLALGSILLYVEIGTRCADTVVPVPVVTLINLGDSGWRQSLM